MFLTKNHLWTCHQKSQHQNPRYWLSKYQKWQHWKGNTKIWPSVHNSNSPKKLTTIKQQTYSNHGTTIQLGSWLETIRTCKNFSQETNCHSKIQSYHSLNHHRPSHVGVIQVHVKTILLDGGFRVNIIINDLQKKLRLPTPRLAPYTLKMVDQKLTKPMGITRDLKIHIHGIPYIVAFIVMKNNVLDANYSLLGHPWLHNVKVTHDWGHNLITIKQKDLVRTIVITKYFDMNNKRQKMLFCYDYMEGVIGSNFFKVYQNLITNVTFFCFFI